MSRNLNALYNQLHSFWGGNQSGHYYTILLVLYFIHSLSSQFQMCTHIRKSFSCTYEFSSIRKNIHCRNGDWGSIRQGEKMGSHSKQASLVFDRLRGWIFQTHLQHPHTEIKRVKQKRGQMWLTENNSWLEKHFLYDWSTDTSFCGTYKDA